MKYKIEINLDNADFVDDYEGAIESVMDAAKYYMQNRDSIMPLYDRNGNRIGLVEMQGSNKNMNHI